MIAALVLALSPQQKLNAALTAGGDVGGFGWSPDGLRALYIADQDVDGMHELFSVGVEPFAAPVRLNDPLEPPAEDQEDYIGGFGPFEPDGERVLFYRTQVTSPFSANSFMYSVGNDGTPAPVSLMPGGSILFAASGRIVYSTGGGGFSDLWSQSLDGAGSPVALTPSIVGSDLISAIAPDGTRVVFAYHNINPASAAAIYCQLPDGSAPPIVLNATTNSARGTRALRVSPDGQLVLYVADDDTDERYELWRAPLLGGSAPVRLSQPLSGNLDVTADLVLSRDGSRVAFRADADQDEVYELYSVSVAGGPVAKLSGTMVAGGDIPAALGTPRIPQFEFSPDGSRVVYRADQDADEVYELYSAPADGSAPGVKLHPGLTGSQDVALLGFRITPDSARVVFAADTQVAGRVEVWSAPTDGSAAPVKLSGPMTSGGSLRLEAPYGARYFLQLAPGGRHVYYLADQDMDETFELYRAPVDGSAAVVKGNAALVAGGDVTGFAPGPIGAGLLYLADQEADDVFELYLVTFPAQPRPKLPATAPSATVVRSVP